MLGLEQFAPDGRKAVTGNLQHVRGSPSEEGLRVVESTRNNISVNEA